MKPQLVIQLPAASLQEDSRLHWAVFSGQHMQACGETALSQLQRMLAEQLPGGGDTLVLVPGELVLLTTARIPSRQRRQIKQALPYMVEELIADNIEEVHLAIPNGDADDSGKVPVAVVHHHLLIGWLDQLFHHGVRPLALVPDSLAVPWREHGHSFFLAGERVLYRDGLHSAQVLPRAQLPVLLQLLAKRPAAELGAAPSYRVYAGNDAGSDPAAQAAEIGRQLGVEVDVTTFAEPAAEVLATTAMRQRDELLNLLQGGYRVQQVRERSERWQRVAAVAGIGLLAYALVAGAGGLFFSWRAGQLEQQSFALYRELFPQERRVISPRKQMLAHLRASGAAAAGSPLPLLAKTAAGMQSAAGVQLDELRYSQQRRDLQLQLRAPSLEALDQLKRQLDGNGLGVEINSASEQGAQTLGRLNVRELQS